MKPKTFGNITVSRVVELEEPMMKPADLLPASNPETIESHRNWLAPNFIDPSGTFIMSIQSFVVRTSHHTILVDTCVGNDKSRDMPSWNMRQGSFLQDMQAIGVRPEEIDFVLCTHLHIDHVGWNTRLQDGHWVPTFPNAKYLFTSQERDYWQGRPTRQAFNHACLDDSVQPVIDAGQVQFIEGDHTIDDEAWSSPRRGILPAMSSCICAPRDSERCLRATSCITPCKSQSPNGPPNTLTWTRRARLAGGSWIAFRRPDGGAHYRGSR